jgi:hypothetical protein
MKPNHSRLHSYRLSHRQRHCRLGKQHIPVIPPKTYPFARYLFPEFQPTDELVRYHQLIVVVFSRLLSRQLLELEALSRLSL